jgi:hypothetical protein
LHGPSNDGNRFILRVRSSGGIRDCAFHDHAWWLGGRVTMRVWQTTRAVDDYTGRA